MPSSGTKNAPAAGAKRDQQEAGELSPEPPQQRKKADKKQSEAQQRKKVDKKPLEAQKPTEQAKGIGKQQRQTQQQSGLTRDQRQSSQTSQQTQQQSSQTSQETQQPRDLPKSAQPAKQEKAPALSPRSSACHAYLREIVQQGLISREEAVEKWVKWRTDPKYQEVFCDAMCNVLGELQDDDEADPSESQLSRKEQRRLELAEDFLTAWHNLDQQREILGRELQRLAPAQTQQTSTQATGLSEAPSDMSSESQDQACKSLIEGMVRTERMTRDQGHGAWEAWVRFPELHSCFTESAIETLQKAESRESKSVPQGEQSFLRKTKQFLQACGSAAQGERSAAPTHQQQIRAQPSEQQAQLQRRYNEVNGLIKHMTLEGVVSAEQGAWTWKEWRTQLTFRPQFRRDVTELVESLGGGDSRSRPPGQRALLESAEAFLATYKVPGAQRRPQAPIRPPPSTLPQPQSQACRALLREMTIQRILTQESEAQKWETWKNEPYRRSEFVMEVFQMRDALQQGRGPKTSASSRDRLLKLAEGFLACSTD